MAEGSSVVITVTKRHPQMVVDVVELSLRGSEFGTEAWIIVRQCLIEDRNPDSEELERLDWLIDRAWDDLEGPGLRVDLSKGRIYK